MLPTEPTEPPTTAGSLDEVRPPQVEELVLVKRNLVTFGYGHVAALYGLYLACTEARWATIVLACVLFVLAAVGVTAGAHRLWAHRSYKATRPLQTLLMVMNSLAFQNSATTWIRDHRLHHRYSDTEAAPQRVPRVLLRGWLLVRRNSSVRRRGRDIDIYANPVLAFQDK